MKFDRRTDNRRRKRVDVICYFSFSITFNALTTTYVLYSTYLTPTGFCVSVAIGSSSLEIGDRRVAHSASNKARNVVKQSHPEKSRVRSFVCGPQEPLFRATVRLKHPPSLQNSINMKLLTAAVAVATTSAFSSPTLPSTSKSQSSLNMVLEKPATKKISKLETLKVNSENLVHPLKEVRFVLLRKS